MQRSPVSLVMVLLVLCGIGAVPCRLPAVAGYWEDQFDLPPLHHRIPPEAGPPEFGAEGLHILSVFQIMTDLGRKQFLEISDLAGASDLHVGCYSFDRVAEQWPEKYVQDFVHNHPVSIPLFSISDEGLRGLFRGYDPGKMRIFPHTLIFDASRSIKEILRGVRTAEELKAAVERSIVPVLDSRTPPSDAVNLVEHGGFESARHPTLPQGWSVYRNEAGTVFAQDRIGWEQSSALEIRSSTARDYRIVYRILPLEKTRGREVFLVAKSRSNSLGIPRVVLAIPHPRLEEGLPFVPRTPIKTRSGKGVPLRIVGSLDFETDHSRWQSLSRTVSVPENARAVVLLLYLDNPTAAGGAARFDEIGVYVE